MLRRHPGEGAQARRGRVLQVDPRHAESPAPRRQDLAGALPGEALLRQLARAGALRRLRCIARRARGHRRCDHRLDAIPHRRGVAPRPELHKHRQPEATALPAVACGDAFLQPPDASSRPADDAARAARRGPGRHRPHLAARLAASRVGVAKRNPYSPPAAPVADRGARPPPKWGRAAWLYLPIFAGLLVLLVETRAMFLPALGASNLSVALALSALLLYQPLRHLASLDEQPPRWYWDGLYYATVALFIGAFASGNAWLMVATGL